ncbi:hypothetical protein Trydic_g21902, partial [Trypoxylus dichotomus]
MYFTPRRKHKKLGEIQIDNHYIEWAKKAKYLHLAHQRNQKADSGSLQRLVATTKRK